MVPEESLLTLTRDIALEFQTAHQSVCPGHLVECHLCCEMHRRDEHEDHFHTKCITYCWGCGSSTVPDGTELSTLTNDAALEFVTAHNSVCPGHQIECELCLDSDIRRDEYDAHMHEHEETQRRIACSNCRIGFLPGEIVNHRSECTTYGCDGCENMFASKEEADEHMRTCVDLYYRYHY
jgi:hypothetical protein